jgi:hypothetical protein
MIRLQKRKDEKWINRKEEIGAIQTPSLKFKVIRTIIVAANRKSEKTI